MVSDVGRRLQGGLERRKPSWRAKSLSRKRYPEEDPKDVPGSLCTPGVGVCRADDTCGSGG